MSTCYSDIHVGICPYKVAKKIAPNISAALTQSKRLKNVLMIGNKIIIITGLRLRQNVHYNNFQKNQPFDQRTAGE